MSFAEVVKERCSESYPAEGKNWLVLEYTGAARKNLLFVCPAASAIGPSRFVDFQRCSNLAPRVQDFESTKVPKVIC